MFDDLDVRSQRLEQLEYLSLYASVVQIQELQGVNRALASILGEVGQIRKLQQTGVQILTAMLAQDSFQAAIEEYIFRFRKSLDQFQEADSHYSVESQFLYLQETLQNIHEYGISTACIRGLDNKATFDGCMTDAHGLHATLANHPNVRRMLENAFTAQKEREAAKLKETMERISEQNREKIQSLSRRMQELKRGYRQDLTFDEWYEYRFANHPSATRRFHRAIGGLLWLPRLFRSEKDMVIEQINGEIADACEKIEVQIANLNAHASGARRRIVPG